jgi:hypothetical protein
MLLTLLSPNSGTPPQTIIWLKVGTIWKQTTAYVKISGVWKTTTPKIKITGIWK